MADGSVRMGDFGLAKELIDKSYAGTIVGTKFALNTIYFLALFYLLINYSYF